MKKVTCLLLLFISITCFSQTVKELKNELHVVRSGETSTSKKDVAIKLLGMDKYNVDAVNYLVRVYSENNQKDSINDLFNRMIRENPKSPEPYMLKAQLRSTTPSQRIDYYKEACKLDSLHSKANYELGRIYYQLFINEFAENRKKENLDEYSRSSIKHFSILCDQDNSYREFLSYPLLQLATYLGDAGLKTRFEPFNVQLNHFPVSEFIDLPTDWQTNFTVDVMGRSGMKFINGVLTPPEKNIVGVEYAKSHIEWYSSELKQLKEPVLNTLEAENVYRFTWLRSFHNVIVVGLVNTNHSINVYWKESDGSGKVNEHTKTLTQNDWTAFDAAIHSIDFWNKPSIKVDPMSVPMDGAQWILEGKASGKYHVVDRWSGMNDIGTICMQLVKFTDLNIKSDEIY